MPIKNEFFGAYKALKVGTRFIVAESASRSRQMEVKQKNFVQGTAKNRIMDVGGVSETISISAPILIGGGAAVDGRSLLNNQIENALLRTGATLPLLQSGEIAVTTEGGMVSLTLQGDGDPETTSTFAIYDQELVELDPITASSPTRTSKFFDFRVNLAGYSLYVQEARIKVEVSTSKVYFLGGQAEDGIPVPASNPNNFGTQFPWLGVSGIQISGGGKAVALVADLNNDYDTTDVNESINVNLQTGQTELTLQSPGCVTTVTEDFAMEVYDGCSNDGTDWKSLFVKADGTTPLFDLSKSMVTKADFQLSPDLLTVNFEFVVYVK